MYTNRPGPHTERQIDRTEIYQNYHNTLLRGWSKSVHASLTNLQAASVRPMCTFNVDCKRKLVSSHSFPCFTFNHPRVESSRFGCIDDLPSLHVAHAAFLSIPDVFLPNSTCSSPFLLFWHSRPTFDIFL